MTGFSFGPDGTSKCEECGEEFNSFTSYDFAGKLCNKCNDKKQNPKQDSNKGMFGFGGEQDPKQESEQDPKQEPEQDEEQESEQDEEKEPEKDMFGFSVKATKKGKHKGMFGFGGM